MHNESPETQCFDNLVRVREGQEVCLPPTPTPKTSHFQVYFWFSIVARRAMYLKKWTQWFSLTVKFNYQTSTSVWKVLKWKCGCSFADWTLSPDSELSRPSKQIEDKECKSCRRLYKQTAPCAVFFSASLPLGGHMGGWQGGQGQDMGNAWIICL